MNLCRSCGAHVVWANTSNGKAAPFEPDPDGDWIITHDGDAIRAGMFDADAQRYTSHFATCPQAAEWRQR